MICIYSELGTIQIGMGACDTVDHCICLLFDGRPLQLRSRQLVGHILNHSLLSILFLDQDTTNTITASISVQFIGKICTRVCQNILGTKKLF